MNEEQIPKEALPETKPVLAEYPSFDEWLRKHFSEPVTKEMYHAKYSDSWHSKDELLRRYKKAFLL
jgi:hypothetical protein